MSFFCSSALAQSDPRVNEEARKRFQEGIQHVKAERYRDARAAFLQAHALRPDSVEILQNLGLVELDAGYTAPGARHLALLLRNFSDRLPQVDLQKVRTRLAKAETQVGRLSIQVVQQGADIEVDGEFVSKAPLTYEWHVDPGAHRISVRKDKLAKTRVVFINAGEVISVHIDLTTEALPSSEAAPEDRPSQPDAPTPTPAAPEPAPIAPLSHERNWTPVYVGLGLTAVSLGVMTFGVVKWSSANDDAKSLQRSLESDTFDTCSIDPDLAACRELDEALDRRSSAGRLTNVSLAASAVFATGTLAAYFWWPKTIARAEVQLLPGPSLSLKGSW